MATLGKKDAPPYDVEIKYESILHFGSILMRFRSIILTQNHLFGHRLIVIGDSGTR